MDLQRTQQTRGLVAKEPHLSWEIKPAKYIVSVCGTAGRGEGHHGYFIVEGGGAMVGQGGQCVVMTDLRRCWFEVTISITRRRYHGRGRDRPRLRLHPQLHISREGLRTHQFLLAARTSRLVRSPQISPRICQNN